MKKISTFLVMIIIMTMMCSVFAFATESNQSYSTQSISVQKGYIKKGEDLTGLADDHIPTVTIDQATNYVQKKGYEVVGFLQASAQPFAIIIFIVSAFILLFGCIGNKKLIGVGVISMIVSISVLTVVMFAPEIMDYMTKWLAA